MFCPKSGGSEASLGLKALLSAASQYHALAAALEHGPGEARDEGGREHAADPLLDRLARVIDAVVVAGERPVRVRIGLAGVVEVLFLFRASDVRAAPPAP